ncbi:MAG: DNA recombination protein RmuC [Burkholderiaceae bacterium]|nr:DNA recombination protein RmuC [Burkholderiaceae bacterium]
MTLDTLILVALLALVLVLQAWAFGRRPRVELPPEWPQRLQALEQLVQATQLAVAKQDGAFNGLAQQLRAFTQGSQATLDSLRHAVDAQLAQAVAESRQGRQEQQAIVASLAAETVQARTAMADSAALIEQRIQQRFEALTAATRLTLDSLKGDIQGQLGAVSMALKDQLEANGSQIRNQFAVLQDAVSQQLGGLVQGSQQNADQLRTALNERLAAIQADNAVKLEAMRRTVDEKLHATLEQRLGESFKQVSDRLEQVHKGLGEMQTLAGSVGDLKRVMTNVKSRGTWGEMQLGAIIENVLTPGQYARNVKTVPGRDELVEFAIRLPGKNEAHPVWLPIDSKYPVETYQRLMDAQDAADKAAIVSVGNAFETSIKAEAKKIAAKYVSPPYTTDFAVLYLPTESLFAEVMRRPGLVEALQNETRVMVTGPANLAAMLNSLQMGFKTLAIEKRSSEVWGLLGQVKTEFGKFGEVVEAAKKSIDTAAKKFEALGTRTHAIQRKLRDVQALPAPDAAPESPAMELPVLESLVEEAPGPQAQDSLE